MLLCGLGFKSVAERVKMGLKRGQLKCPHLDRRYDPCGESPSCSDRSRSESLILASEGRASGRPRTTRRERRPCAIRQQVLNNFMVSQMSQGSPRVTSQDLWNIEWSASPGPSAICREWTKSVCCWPSRSLALWEVERPRLGVGPQESCSGRWRRGCQF